MVFKSILIVDDDEVSNFITERTIQINLGSKVKTVTNGHEAIKFLEEHDHPDLILLDLNMPLMNGIEFLEYLEINGIQPKSSIVILTTSGRDKDKELIKQFEYVKGYIEKPLDIGTLKQLLSM